MSEQKNPIGPPTKYRDDIPKKLTDYFKEQRYFNIGDKAYPEFNSIEGFCAEIRIAKSTFYEWIKIHPELSNAFNAAKNYQASQLYNLGLNRIWAEGYAKLITVNCTGMRDKIESTVDQKTIQINIDKEDSEL